MKLQLKSAIVFLLITLQLISCQKDDCENCGTADAVFKANAGPDQTILLPQDSVLLDGSHSSSFDDKIIKYEWSMISGPIPFKIVNEEAAKTQVTDLINGIYKFRFSVMDAAGRVAKDTMQVTVLPKLPNDVNEPCDKSNRPIVNAQLIPFGTLSEARAGVSVAAAGNKIVFAGAALSSAGVNGYGSSRVDIYDIVTNKWSIAKLSEVRSNIAAVAAGNKIFFAGGRLGDGAFDMLFSTVDIYDVATNTWSVASLSEPRAHIAAATVGNKVLFAGGEKNWNYETSDRVDIYDLSTNSWSTASLSLPRSYTSAVTVNNKIYFAGGQWEDRWYSSPLDKIDVFDNSTNSWSTSNLSEPMGFLAGIAVSDNIYWMSGCKMETKNVNTWQGSIDYLFSPAGWGIIDKNVVLKDNKLLLFRIGGENANKFDIYDLNTKTWSIGILPQNNIEYRSIISVNNTVYLAGGIIGSMPNLTDQVWKLEF